MSNRKGVAAGLRISRLASRITELEGMLEAKPPGRSEALRATDDAARAALTKARAAVDGDSTLQNGWADCNQAYLFILQGADEVERTALAKALRWETQEKIRNWRKDAVREILPESGQSPEVQELVVAQFIVDKHFDNVYFKLDLLGQRVKSLFWWLLGVVTALMALSGFLAYADTEHGILSDPATLATMMVLGAAGAALSSALSAVGSESRIPQALEGWVDVWVRFLVGALSAATVVIVVDTGILPFLAPGEPRVPGGTPVFLYAYALSAGFTDRLLNRVMLAVEESATK